MTNLNRKTKAQLIELIDSLYARIEEEREVHAECHRETTEKTDNALEHLARVTQQRDALDEEVAELNHKLANKTYSLGDAWKRILFGVK